MRRVLKSFWNTLTCLFLDPCEMKVFLIFWMRTPRLRWGSQFHTDTPFLSLVSLERSALVPPSQGASLSQSAFISKDLLSTYYAAGIRDTSMEKKNRLYSSGVCHLLETGRQSTVYMGCYYLCERSVCMCVPLFMQRISRRTHLVQWLQDGWGWQGDISLLALVCLLSSRLSYSFFQIKCKKKT